MIGIEQSKFPLNIVQEDLEYCVPATVEAMFKYHDPNFKFDQHQIMEVILKNNDAASFGAIRKHFQKYVTGSFEIEERHPENFDEWLSTIISELKEQRPLAISTRISPKNVHIRVAITYDDTKNNIELYNPGKVIRQEIDKDGQIIIYYTSCREVYGIHQAKQDWDAPDSCKAQLLIRKE